MSGSLAPQPLARLSLEQFLDALGTRSPAPGGGAAAAVAGALGGALVVMVARVTLNRQRYAVQHDEMAWVETEALALQQRLTALMEADAAAYQAVADAYALPRVTQTDVAIRAAAAESALRGAVESPLAAAAACADLLALAVRVAERGSPSAAADAAVAALLAHAALQGAARNVRANVAAMRDAAFCQAAAQRAAELAAIGEERLAQALAASEKRGEPAPAPTPRHIGHEGLS